MSDLIRLHSDLEIVVQDIKALKMHAPDDEEFKKNLNKESVKYGKISQVYNAITGIGEIGLWMERSACCRGLQASAKAQMDQYIALIDCMNLLLVAWRLLVQRKIFPVSRRPII